MRQTTRDKIQVKQGMKWCARCKSEYPATGEYFTTRKDSKDGLAGFCRQCTNRISNVYKQSHPDIVRETKRRSQEIHKERKYQQEKRRIQNNPEIEHQRRKASALKRFEKNPDYEREKLRNAIQKYRVKHRDKVLLLNDRYRARKKGLPSTFTLPQWQLAQVYWEHSCAYCEQLSTPDRKLVMDHFIPLSHSDCPGTLASNMLPVCRSCNSKKGNQDALVWLIKQFGEKQAQMRFEAIKNYFQWLSESNNA